MWYHFSLTVPAGTAENSPVEADLKLTHGVVVYIGVGFPKQCKQLVKARIYHEEHQLFPSNPDEPAAWDGDIEGGRYHYRLVESPYLLTLRGYAPNATRGHTITAFINLLALEAAEPWMVQTSILDKIKSMFGLS